MTVKVYNKSGEEKGTIDLSDEIFGIEPNIPAVHAAVVNILANKRQGTQSTLTRTEVSGGGKKPWRQKGTGHARQGSTRAPQWRHGGIALGPKPRSYRYTLNKKVRRLAFKSALSLKAREGGIIVLDEFKLAEYKTREVVKLFNALGAAKKVLFVLDTVDSYVIKSASNIPGAKTAQVGTLNTYDIVNADKVVVLKGAVSKIEEVYA
ncbi:MAG: 50S ribosomal protein L4 [Oscillospiraceae bacterium]|jgi:large subunit ribosomal protein L4|nr:50S ribosomal protein L4 [Oscillospiraceae bacterium]